MLTKEDMDVFEASIREQLIAQKEKLGFSDEKLGLAAFHTCLILVARCRLFLSVKEHLEKESLRT
ncbi:MAG: hypothetical protein IK079_03945 [Desulfovibrio sp.]|nr:hypothetical protein [Desulfovibrio sp.]